MSVNWRVTSLGQEKGRQGRESFTKSRCVTMLQVPPRAPMHILSFHEHRKPEMHILSFHEHRKPEKHILSFHQHWKPEKTVSLSPLER